MASTPGPSSEVTVTLNVHFNANEQEQDAHGFYAVANRAFAHTPPTRAAAALPEHTGQLLKLIAPGPGSQLYIVFLESSGTIDQSNQTISKFWIAGNSGDCPLLGPLPTQTSPWTVVFRGQIASGTSGTVWGWTGTEGFPIQARPNSDWSFSVFLQITVLGVTKTFKADVRTSIIVPKPVTPVTPMPVGVEGIVDPKAE